MQINFFKKTDITQDEFIKVSLMVLQSFFLGFFIYYYFSVINGLFTATFPIQKLPLAYIHSGLFGFFLTNIFIKLQKKIKLSYLQIGLYATIIIYMLLYLWLFSSENINFHFYSFKSFKPFIIYVGFILFFPISTLLILGMGNMMLKLFDLKQGKRFFPIISSGEVLSSALAFISIPGILSLFSENDTEKGTIVIFSLAIIFLFAAALMQLYFNFKYKTLINQNTQKTKSNNTPSFKSIITNKYYLNIIFLIFISTVVFYIINFTFLRETKNEYKSSNEIIRFFGFFYFIYKLLEFVLKTFFSGKLLTNYGIKAGLFILPIVIFVFTLLSISSLVFEFNSEITFLMIILNMLFLLVLKRAFEDSAIKLLFQPIDSSSKLTLQSIGLGNTSQISIIISGLIIYLISDISEDNLLLYILISVLVLITFWFLSISKVVKYLNVYIKNSLKKINIKFNNDSKDSMEIIKKHLYLESKKSIQKDNTESTFLFLDINNNLLTIRQYYQLYFNERIEQKKLNNSILEFSKNFETSLQHKAILLCLSTRKNTSNFIIEQLNITSGFETRLFIFKYISKNKIDLTDQHLQSISSIMNDLFDYYSCILFSTIDLNYDEKNNKLIELLNYELSVLEDILFLYLEILYPKDQIDLIKQALKSDKHHENILALELLESFIDDEYKAIIITILDNLSIKSKIDNLSISFNHYRLKLNQRLNYILNSPAYWFNDLIRIETIDLIPTNYEIKNSALLSHIFNSNKSIKSKAMHKLSLIDNNNSYSNNYLKENKTKNILARFYLINEKLNIQNINENFKFKLYSNGIVVNNLTSKELEKLNNKRYVLFLLNGNIKLPFKNYNAGEIVNPIKLVLLDKSMFSKDIAYLRILHQKLVPFIMSNPSFAEQIDLNQ
jgi:ATP/ADP translocase